MAWLNSAMPWLPSARGRGIATAVVRELVARARAAHVDLVVAYTLPATSPSTSVLRRCGFVQAAEVVDPDDGLVWRWELPLGHRDLTVSRD